MGSVRVAIVGVGNCATSLIQGVHYYRDADPAGDVPGLMHVQFGVHFALFSQTAPEVRVRILEGRRARLEERREGVRTTLARTRERLDSYTLQLQEHGLESVDREVRWLSELIETERRNQSSVNPASPL